MFYQRMGIFQSLTKRYAPLSGVESGDGSPDSDTVTPQPRDNTEKVYRDERTPVCSCRRYLAALGIFFVGLLVGGVLGVLCSTYTEHPRAEEWTPSNADFKQFAPQSEHLPSYMRTDCGNLFLALVKQCL